MSLTSPILILHELRCAIAYNDALNLARGFPAHGEALEHDLEHLSDSRTQVGARREAAKALRQLEGRGWAAQPSEPGHWLLTPQGLAELEIHRDMLPPMSCRFCHVRPAYLGAVPSLPAPNGHWDYMIFYCADCLRSRAERLLGAALRDLRVAASWAAAVVDIPGVMADNQELKRA